mmetsp:Transcript_7967/g.11835  ORF Transcript_7967/g.11835 Transcript_7967/m.11835 type:complete len:265 (+) Transcript_7967:31-825(+)
MEYETFLTEAQKHVDPPSALIQYINENISKISDVYGIQLKKILEDAHAYDGSSFSMATSSSELSATLKKTLEDYLANAIFSGKKKKKKKKKKKVAVDDLADQEPELDEHGEANPTWVLAQFMKQFPDRTDAQLNYAIKCIKTEYDMKSEETVCLIFAVLIRPSSVIEDIEKYARFFLPFVKKVKSQEKVCKYAFKFVKEHRKVLLPFFSAILDAFYRHFVISDDVIKSWYASIEKKVAAKSSSYPKNVLLACKPFMNALEEENA